MHELSLELREYEPMTNDISSSKFNRGGETDVFKMEISVSVLNSD